MIRFKSSNHNYRVSSSGKEAHNYKPVDRDRNRINLNIVLRGEDEPEADGGDSLHGIGVTHSNQFNSSPHPFNPIEIPPGNREAPTDPQCPTRIHGKKSERPESGTHQHSTTAGVAETSPATGPCYVSTVSESSES